MRDLGGLSVTLHEYLMSLRKYWVVIALLTVLGALAGYGYAAVQTETYRSSAEVVIVPARGDSTSELVQGSNYVQNLVQTYAVVATSPTVLQPVVDDLALSVSPRALAGTITVEAPLNTQILRIGVVSRDPAAAADIANAVADQLAVAVRDLSPQNADEQPAVRIETISPAVAANFPSAPNVRLLTTAGALGGLVAGIAFAVLRRLLATRLVTHPDVAAVSDLPVLGDVYTTSGGRALPAVVRTEPTSAVSESVRSFIAGLRFSQVDGAKKVLLFTSSNSGDGKSSLSVATALILAEQGSSVLLIDADLRRATVAQLTQLEGAVGLTTVLLGELSLDVAVQSLGSDGAFVLTSGAVPPNPGQILASDQVRDLVHLAREQYDFVIIDSPPVLAVSDPLILAPLVDGIVVVVRSRVTKRESLRRALAALESSPAPVLGVVINGAKPQRSNPYYETEANRTARLRARRETPATDADD